MLPDLVLLIEIPSEEAAVRLGRRDAGRNDRIGGRDAAYHAGVAAAFAQFAAAEPERFVRIDGSGDIAATQAQILAAVAPLLGEAP